MPTGEVLTPSEAAKIATNAYFTLENWINKEPRAGVESRANIENRVLGSATAGSQAPGSSSLKGTKMGSAKLGNIHEANTGIATRSGFGYTLTYDGNGKKHVVLATRGTRPELPGMAPDILTDIRGSMTSFGDYGPVHKGFKKTYDSIRPHIARDSALVANADVVHCVGHSLGGAVATLIAGHCANTHNNVKLYTFGCPRVGCLNTYKAFEEKIGKANIYRVAHDLDPFSLIAPFPYIHVNPGAKDWGNMTLPSPTSHLFSTDNHDMARYITSVEGYTWQSLRGKANKVDHDNALVARWLLHKDTDPGWVRYASAKTLAILFKLFSHVLRTISTSLILGLSAVDLLAEVLMKGLNKLHQLQGQIFTLLKYAAQWAGIQVAKSADITASIIKAILTQMLSTLRNLAANAVSFTTRNITPIQIGIAGALTLTSFSAL